MEVDDDRKLFVIFHFFTRIVEISIQIITKTIIRTNRLAPHKLAGLGTLNIIQRPEASEFMGRQPVSPYDGFGDYLYGYLYYPREKMENNEKLPVVIYLHEYDYSKGFS